MGNEVLLDPGLGRAVVMNGTDVATDEVYSALESQHPVVAAMTRWATDIRLTANRHLGGGLFERDRYATPRGVFEQMRVAQDAVESDDVVSGVLETTEALAFSTMSFWCEDEDEQDVWNQWAAEVDLDARLREMWRELFTSSQCYVAMWWGTRDYKVRGKSDKNVTRKRTFSRLEVPIALSLMDPLKVTPVGQLLFGRERLAYIADRNEVDAFDRALNNRAAGGGPVDPIVERLIIGKYDPPLAEQAELREHGVDASRLYLLNPAYVFRHTATRPGYRRFSAIRMKSVFELLDIKQQLRQMDRAFLIGGTNFIVLIKKGSDKQPAQPEEIANLQANVAVIARVPVIVGDHRLSVEIVTPTMDKTLDEKRYDTVDDRIAARLLQMFTKGGRDTEVTTAQVVAAGMESRRKMIRRSIEANVLRPMFTRNEQLTGQPDLLFHPKKIALAFDANFAAFLLDLREIGDLSRESMLYQFDFDQADEAARRRREKDKYDDTFETTIPGAIPPGTAPAGQPAPASNAAKKAAGRRTGGNNNGGGRAPGTGQGKAPRNVRKKSDGSQNGRRQRVAAELEPEELDAEEPIETDVETEDDE